MDNNILNQRIDLTDNGAVPTHGQHPTPTAQPVSNEEFIREVFRDAPPGSTALVCSKPGDPSTGGWFAFPPGDLPASNNNYVAASSFLPADGKWKNRREQVAAVHFLMLDDIGGKIPLEKLTGLKLSWLLETSPGNFQGGIIFKEPVSPDAAEKLLKSIIQKGLCDPGATGAANRWARLPKGINGKAKYRDSSGKPFYCRLDEWRPEQRYDIGEIRAALGLESEVVAGPASKPTTSPEAAAPRPQLPLDEALAKCHELINHIPPDVQYQDWIAAGMAIWHETGGHKKGLMLFDEWSSGGEKYPGPQEICKQWDSFRPVDNPRKMGTLVMLAKQNGYKKDEDWAESEKAGVPGDAESAPPEPVSEELALATAYGQADDVVKKAQEDSGAAFEADSIAALARIKISNQADYERIRSALKKQKVSVSKLDRAVKDWEKVNEVEAEARTHHGFAQDIIEHLTVGTSIPVGHHGDLYVLNPERKIWERKPLDEIIKVVTARHDGHELCRRSSDYSAIAQHAVSIASRQNFFKNAPVGVATPDGFYSIEGEKIKIEPLMPEHRQRLILDIAPEKLETPQFNIFLEETFKAKDQEETRQQIRLLQEIFGATMLGLMARYHKAVLFYDPFGRSGKGVTVRILQKLIPAGFTSAVSPFNWDKEYFLATLVGMRLNVVGELPENKAIPAADFKTVTGGDMLTGRHPTRRPVSFKNEAAHIFMSNHFITTKDQSEAFFSRWLLLEFPNSLIRNGKPIDPGLPERIIASEMPGIAYWALQGAKRLIDNGKFSGSIVHDRLMASWRKHTNSLLEFIDECCEEGEYVRRSKFYEFYKIWCGENGRHAFAKGKVKDLLENNNALGVRLGNLDGYEVFRGIRMKEQEIKNPADDVNWQK